MKKLFCLLFIFPFTLSFAQSPEKLKSDTKSLYAADYVMDFEAIAGLTYPKVIEETGKEVWLGKIEKYYENEEYRVRQQLELVPFQFGSIKKIESRQFCVITCNNPMRYFFENKLSDEAATAMAAKLKGTLKATEVIFESKRNSFNIRKTTTFIAVSDETTGYQWKFFNFDEPGQESFFRNFFSERILKELKL